MASFVADIRVDTLHKIAADAVAKEERPKDPQPWVQPLFMVYDAAVDQMAPLTQERLDILLDTERQYGFLINQIRESHAAHCQRLGFMPRPFAELPK